MSSNTKFSGIEEGINSAFGKPDHSSRLASPLLPTSLSTIKQQADENIREFMESLAQQMATINLKPTIHAMLRALKGCKELEASRIGLSEGHQIPHQITQFNK